MPATLIWRKHRVARRPGAAAGSSRFGRKSGSGHAATKQAPSTSQMRRFETEILATEENLAGFGDVSDQWIDRVHDRCPPKKIVLDLDGSVSPTYGDQEGTANLS